MGSMSGVESASMPLLPEWLRMLWVAALLGAAALHVRHAWLMPGQTRWWHAGHTTMAIGMTLMYLLDRMQHPALYQAGLAVFASALLTVAAITAAISRREGVLNPLWLASTLDLLAMVYMLLPAENRNAALTGVVVIYLTCQVLAWVLGWWDRAPAPRHAVASAQALSTESNMATDATMPLTATGSPAAALLGPAQQVVQYRQRELCLQCTLSTRASLAVMAAAMGYMLAVM